MKKRLQAIVVSVSLIAAPAALPGLASARMVGKDQRMVGFQPYRMVGAQPDRMVGKDPVRMVG